jgi:hypothetical protein
MPDIDSFVWTVYNDLDDLVQMRFPLLVRPPEEWTTGGDDLQRLQQFAGWLGETWPGVMATRDQVIEIVRSLDDDQLASAGLVGVQLDTKLLIWRRARDLLDQALMEYGRDPAEVEPDEPPPGVEPERRIRRFVRLVRAKTVCKWASRALGHADTVLDSLLRLVPGVGETLSELKKTVEKVTGEVAEDLRP